MANFYRGQLMNTMIDFKGLSQWTIHGNHWCDAEEAANKLEDLFQISYKEYVIDVGYYGKNKIFILYVLKGNFLNGELIEKFSSKTLHEIKRKVAEYCLQIPSGKVFESQKIVDGLVNGNLL